MGRKLVITFNYIWAKYHKKLWGLFRVAFLGGSGTATVPLTITNCYLQGSIEQYGFAGLYSTKKKKIGDFPTLQQYLSLVKSSFIEPQVLFVIVYCFLDILLEIKKGLHIHIPKVLFPPFFLFNLPFISVLFDQSLNIELY